VRLVFAGTPTFAAVALKALIDAGHAVALVLTQPDRPAGRGLKPRPSAVKLLADDKGIAVLQPATLRDDAAVAAIADVQPDAMVVAAYGLMIPARVLALPRLGCLNIHASLLPRWRGAAPIQRALLAGDTVTGVTIMQMNEALDAGPILLQEAVAIDPRDTAQTLHDRLAELGARLIVRALDAPLRPRPQDESLATYAPKIDKNEARIDWTQSAERIERKVRAFNPYPGAYTRLDGVVLKIWGARVERGAAAPPGVVVGCSEAGIVVGCGADALRITEVQRAGGKRLSAGAFLAGHRLAPGARLGD
jgi:methionyl-tRNA formyltransferase